MSSSTLKQYIGLIISLVILTLSIPAVFYLSQKADLPITVASSEGSLLIKSSREGTTLKVNDRIISIDGIVISSREDIELILDFRKIGDKVILSITSGSQLYNYSAELVNFYSLKFLIIQSIAAFFFLLIGLFVLLRSKDNKAAELFYLASTGAAVIMIMTWGNYSGSFGLSHILRFLFEAAYIFTPVLFVHFGLTFPKDQRSKFRIFIRMLYFCGTILFILNVYTFTVLTRELTPGTISDYRFSFTLGRVLLAACIVISITIFLVGYFKTKDMIQKKKLKWLITGFLVGPLSFILLWVIPQAVTDYGLIPEEFIPILMLAVPVTFTISILKYRLLDIDFILKRSVIYFSVTAGIFLLYIGIVLSVTWLIRDINQTLLSGVSAIMVAFLFNPLKNSIQSFVNKKFFRVQYNFRQAEKLFYSEIKEIYDIHTLANKIIAGICRIIPIEKIAFIEISDKNSPVMLSSINFNETDLQFIRREIVDCYELNNSIVVPGEIEEGEHTFDYDPSLKEIRINLVLCAQPVKGKSRFILAAGNKKGDNKYSLEDLDLLHNILNTASSIGERIMLQENLIRKELEAEKLISINEQKSLFVSTVSHDLKTPLTSIRMYSELIKMNDEKKKINDFAEYIEGESERLTRLINNVLNYSSIEKGIKEYSKAIVDLNLIIRKSLAIMEYQLKVQHFTNRTCIPENEMLIYADPDALVEVFINLVSNAIKYSPEKKEIETSVIEKDDEYSVEVRDYGIGISEEAQKKLFTPFFRSDEAQKMKIGGTGLGLSIIKHTADANNIKIETDSKLSEGTTFRLRIPKLVQERL